MKLQTLKSSLPRLQPRLAQAQTMSDQRMAGRQLQARRQRVWTRSPCCASCGRVVDLHGGQWELDHKVPLEQGGPDTDENCQVLCVEWVNGEKRGCHAAKTAAEAKARARP